MSKPNTPRALADNEAQAIVSNLRVSPRKLNLVAGMIRNLPAQRAVATLTFSKRRIAQQVKKALESAIANAENNHQLDPNDLVVSEAFVGKNMVLNFDIKKVQIKTTVNSFGAKAGALKVDPLLVGVGIGWRF